MPTSSFEHPLANLVNLICSGRPSLNASTVPYLIRLACKTGPSVKPTTTDIPIITPAANNASSRPSRLLPALEITTGILLLFAIIVNHYFDYGYLRDMALNACSNGIARFKDALTYYFFPFSDLFTASDLWTTSKNFVVNPLTYLRSWAGFLTAPVDEYEGGFWHADIDESIGDTGTKETSDQECGSGDIVKVKDSWVVVPSYSERGMN